MKLYHATQIDNKDNILTCGLQPVNNNHSSFEREIKSEGIYGFTALEDAKGFAIDQCWNGGFVVFSFEADEDALVLDPEYIDAPEYGIAYFYATETGVDAVLEVEF